MVTKLHQQLKDYYADDPDRQEVNCDGYRIDAVDSRGRLVEIQCASLAAIRDKTRRLLESHRVTVVKPLPALRRITTLDRRDGDVIRSRLSPARQSLAHLFLELVHFGVFPHPRLQLDVLLIEQEEIRIPPTARSSWKKKYSVQDRMLVSVQRHIRLKTAADLWRELAVSLTGEFTTGELAAAIGVPRWLAQKAAWCFRRMEFIDACGKQGNSIVYRLVKKSRRRAA